MNEFNRCNQVTGVYWLKQPISDIKIRISLKHQDGLLSLPKFEEYADETASINLTNLETKTEQYKFRWQEKVFSVWESSRYNDVHNCITDTELLYHDMLKEDQEPSKVFTYIHEDFHLPLPSEIRKKDSGRTNLSWCLEKLSLKERIGRFISDSSSMGHLFKSEENILEQELWTAMHVVLDQSEYNENSQLLLKQESILVSLYHNRTNNCLILSPDVNNLDMNPYKFESSTGLPGYQYAVDVVFGEAGSNEELVLFLRKLYNKWENKQKVLISFTMPTFDKKMYYVTIEIQSARDFEEDHMYVEYKFQIPDKVLCGNTLNGRTHKSEAIKKDGSNHWFYGHSIDLTLEAVSGSDPPVLRLFFEVISTDWWSRHRTEGYTYLPLTLQPGRRYEQLSCSRPEELDDLEAMNRRFFVGGCHLIKDLEVLAKPQLQDAKFKYTTTGTLSIACDVITQSCTEVNHFHTTSSTARSVLRGAEAALRHYKKARARLAAATDGLQNDA